MTLLEQRLTDFKHRIDGWTPQTGFRTADINFSPEDIIFGRRIAAAVRKHGCCTNPDLVIDEIRHEARQMDGFEEWFSGISPERLQTLCEFLIYETPPH